jgi:hypothetical protein
MRKTLTTQTHETTPDKPELVDLYPVLALASLVGYAMWELAVLLP